MRSGIYTVWGDPEDRRFYQQFTDEEIIRWHVEYYQKGESMSKIADRYGIDRRFVSRRFKALGLPIAYFVEHRAYTPPNDHEL